MTVHQHNDFAELERMDPVPGTNPFMEDATPRAKELARFTRRITEVKPVLKSRYLVKGWLDRGTSSVVYGESNVGKTFFALDLAMHVAAGMDWHGNRVPTADKWAGPVLYIASEGGYGINSRIEAMRRDRPDLIKAVGRNFALMKVGLDLCTSQDAAHLIEMIRADFEQAPSLIVVDTLARSMGSGDENTAQDMGKFIKSIDQLREATGAHVMIIHHSGKDASKGARGSGSLRAAADTEIELTRAESVVTAETRKQRDMACDGVFSYSLKSVFIGHDEDGDKITSAVIEEAEAAPRKVRLTGGDKIALQALSDALAMHGKVMHSPLFPANRQCVTLEAWRAMCDRHSLSSGESASAQRTAFMRIKSRLQDKEIIRVVDGMVWCVSPADQPSHPSHGVTISHCDEAPAAVTSVTPPYRGVTSVTRVDALQCGEDDQ
ncbi:MAG TPA: helicase RepA family protein [Paracoccus sp. (in: a-proteobacteria)]|uniref:AAA family ATPase n=1 Tax=Paracoccus sp. TaxID=267 RepID=UPI002BED7967|nr:helicase RepA family protein [Paracoccus sp. (in: a-proteobacteria)]HWL56400.1 helicase RepA family protein [Paracoccus sp. (in: a-proteobacteria)]